MLHGQSPSQPSCRQTVSSKYAGRELPRRARGSPGPAALPPCSSRHPQRRSRGVRPNVCPQRSRSVSAPLASVRSCPLCHPHLVSWSRGDAASPPARAPGVRGFCFSGMSARERAVSSGVFSSPPPTPQNPGLRRYAGSVKRAPPATRPRGKLFGEILKNWGWRGLLVHLMI